jgi:hypothetical protein
LIDSISFSGKFFYTPDNCLAYLHFLLRKFLYLLGLSVHSKLQPPAFGKLLLEVKSDGQAYVSYELMDTSFSPKKKVFLLHSCVWTFCCILRFQDAEKKGFTLYFSHSHPKSKAIRRWVLSRKTSD